MGMKQRVEALERRAPKPQARIHYVVRKADDDDTCPHCEREQATGVPPGKVVHLTCIRRRASEVPARPPDEQG